MRTLLVIVFTLFSTVAHAATYYVRTDGNNACVGTTNAGGSSGACAWRTIEFSASNTVVAGDVVRVQVGTYAEVVTPGRNGSSGGGTITYVADGVVTFCGMDFDNNASYQRWIGFVIDTDAGGCSYRARAVTVNGASNDHLEFWNNTIRDAADGFAVMDGGGAFLSGRMNNSIMMGNNFLDIDLPCVGGLCSGGVAISHAGSHNLFGYSDFTNIYCDAYGANGTYNRYLNDYHHAMIDDASCHSDYWQFGSHPLGLSFATIEGLMQVGVGTTGDEHTTIIQNYDESRCTGGVPAGCGAVTEILARLNLVYNIGSGAWSMAVADNSQMTRFRLYADTMAYINQAAGGSFGNSGVCCAFYDSAAVDFIYILNNIHYEAWWPGTTTENLSVYTLDATNFTMNGNLAYDATTAVPNWAALWTNQSTKQTQVNPNFTNPTSDWHLAAGSGDGVAARGTGVALTTTSGSGTGTTFSVATGGGGFFRGSDAANLDQYGGALAAGDRICVGTDIVDVASVTGDSITVATPFTWANGEGVHLGTDCSPDLGAYPYKAGGYTLTAEYACAGGTCAITPNDASLVRFVVCFNDSVPYAVDNASPYSCATPSGTFSARAYNYYASTTRWATATAGGAEPAPASRIRIRVK